MSSKRGWQVGRRIGISGQAKCASPRLIIAWSRHRSGRRGSWTLIAAVEGNHEQGTQSQQSCRHVKC